MGSPTIKRDDFWAGRRVFITGHTGFKGAWLALWLWSRGAKVTGFSLPPETTPNLFELLAIEKHVESRFGDIRDFGALKAELESTLPEVVFHLAAQSLVRRSYEQPVETYHTNILGTVHLLEAVRQVGGVRAVVVVTSDKCYENREWSWGYREIDPLGGDDPYSSSKGCAELVTAAYIRSYFHHNSATSSSTSVASVRAGNVVGGGDWAQDRLVPDAIAAFRAGVPLRVRNPGAVRPWQHVLEPLSGYLLTARRLMESPASTSGAWNFGPRDEDVRPVHWVVDRLAAIWGEGATWRVDSGDHPHEARYLKLDSTKARSELGWEPLWSVEEALERTARWYRCHHDGASQQQLLERTLADIAHYESRCKNLRSQLAQ